MIYFLDTSAILNGAYNIYGTCYISPLSIQELENIKTSNNKSERVKFLARQAVRDLLSSSFITPTFFSRFQVNRVLHKYKFLQDIPDHRILAEAILMLEKHDSVHFITSDGAQLLFARQISGLESDWYGTERFIEQHEDYCGWSKYYPTSEEMALLYSNPELNTLKCKTNEFAEIFEGNELKDVLFWNGKKYRPLRYKEIKNNYIGQTIKPRNLEQKMALDLLQNDDIPVKLLTSAWGGGKTLLALSYALDQITHGNYQKLIFVRNNIIVSDTNDIGFLPGTIQEKMAIWAGPLADHLGGPDMLNQMIEDGIIEIIPLSHIRGRSISNAVVVCDECENMTDKLVTLLMSRIETTSQLVFCGDVAQIDNHKFEQNNGIRAMINTLSGDNLFGMVKLIKSERNAIAQLCDRMIPPK